MTGYARPCSTERVQVSGRAGDESQSSKISHWRTLEFFQYVFFLPWNWQSFEDGIGGLPQPEKTHRHFWIIKRILKLETTWDDFAWLSSLILETPQERQSRRHSLRLEAVAASDPWTLPCRLHGFTPKRFTSNQDTFFGLVSQFVFSACFAMFASKFSFPWFWQLFGALSQISFAVSIGYRIISFFVSPGSLLARSSLTYSLFLGCSRLWLTLRKKSDMTW